MVPYRYQGEEPHGFRCLNALFHRADAVLVETAARHQEGRKQARTEVIDVTPGPDPRTEGKPL
jgi:hypothetical protein